MRAMIGVDPHKGSHTAVAIGPAEEPLGRQQVRACPDQARQLLAWAAVWPERTWAVEGATGLGRLLAQQLAAAGEQVLDIEPKLAAAEQDITAENDLVMVRLVVTATVKGSLLGVPADGKPVRWNAIDIYRITDGKISEEWAADDITTIMTQVGVFTPPWAA